MSEATRAVPQAPEAVHAPLALERVVSLAINLPGPLAAARLRDLGAEVITLLPPSGDPIKAAAPQWFDELHAGMEVRTVNLKDPQELESLHELLHNTDLLITSNRPSALARLGLDFDSLHQRHPHLCQIAIVGHPGPEADVPGHDLTYQAVNGVLRPPAMPLTLVSDLAGAERAVSEALAALMQRERFGGGGCLREVALSDAAAAMALPLRHQLTTEGGVLGGGFPAYNIYRAREGHVALAALEPQFLKTTLRELGVDNTKEAFEEVLAQRTAAEWEAWADTHDVPLTAVHHIVGSHEDVTGWG